MGDIVVVRVGFVRVQQFFWTPGETAVSSGTGQ